MSDQEASWPIPVLGFHHLDPDLDDYTSFHPEKYLDLLSILAERFEFLTASVAMSADRRISTGRQPLVLTFDDAYANLSDPVLSGIKDFDAVGTIYTITGHVGGYNTWNRKCDYWSQHLDVAGLRDLAAAGMEIGSHTREHFNLAKLPAEVLSSELADSQEWLQDMFGTRARSLAYPYGFHSANVRSAAASLYDHAFTTTTKPGGTDVIRDRFRLRRFMVTRQMSVDEVLTGIDQLWGVS
ncbi:polysaccharide deacetylase family protein [Glycomyces buryatensis]|uniref:Polysaccharide deacetylase family protein n=1 Tax=Glycomyces buryatensis TaxID=2570927 RepID=A0A4S8QD03_9ACTN|nr:polysaccharide deacetylase family protein [Glycomyces buryatensis]THV41481.1 polysaccharide deacetylase family protein [Glycomyces buryatensis]